MEFASQSLLFVFYLPIFSIFESFTLVIFDFAANVYNESQYLYVRFVGSPITATVKRSRNIICATSSFTVPPFLTIHNAVVTVRYHLININNCIFSHSMVLCLV
jgi:hypothetical protein